MCFAREGIYFISLSVQAEYFTIREANKVWFIHGQWGTHSVNTLR